VGDRRHVCRVLVEKPVAKNPFGRPRRKLKNNIKMDFRDVVWGDGLDLSGSG
jgi:hypothetical protein